MPYTPYIFDYMTFYNYYTDPKHVFIDPNTKPNLWFYKTNITTENPSFKPWPKTYILVGGVPIYVSIDRDYRIYFTFPHFENNMFWDNHYHFGLKLVTDLTKVKPRPQKRVVFFHKTTQNPIERKKNQQVNCYFDERLQVDTVENIICQQGSAKTIMVSHFPSEIHIIKEIISRPFVGPILTGGLASRTIYKGKRGGLYIIKNKSKVYLSKGIKS